MRGHTKLHKFFVAICIGMWSSPASGGLVARWKLDEPAGTAGPGSILDTGPSARHHGTPVFVENLPVTFEVPGATENTGTAAAFAADSIDVSYDPALNPESFTFCAWANANSTYTFQSVVTSRHDLNPEFLVTFCITM